MVEGVTPVLPHPMGLCPVGAAGHKRPAVFRFGACCPADGLKENLVTQLAEDKLCWGRPSDVVGLKEADSG